MERPLSVIRPLVKDVRVSERRSWTILAGAIGATILLVAAGFSMQRHQLPFEAAVALTYGVIFWALVARATLPARAESAPVGPVGERPRMVLVATAFALAVLAWSQAGGNVFRTVGVLAWIGAVAFWLAAWWPQPVRGSENARLTTHAAARWPAALGLAAILASGAAVYFHDLARTPGNPTSDHAETLLDVQDVLRGQRPIFFPRNTGREPWKFYTLYVLIRVFGLPAKYLTLKIATVLIGLAAIPAVYLLGSELGGPALGLFAAALVSWADWPLSMARIGLRVSYAVLPTALALWALARYLRKGDRASVLWAGVAMGIGFFGYIPARAVPLMIPVAVGVALLDPRWRGKRVRLAADALLVVDTALFVFLPLCRFMVERPDLFWMRAHSRTGEKVALGRSAATFLDNVRNMLFAFHWRGDSTWVNAVTRAPFLDAVAGALLLAGVVLAIVLARRGELRWIIPLAAIFVLTLPSTLSLTFPDENPSVNRSIAAVPAVFVLAGLPLAFLARQSRPGAGRRIAGGAFVALLLFVSARESGRRYFVDFARQYDTLVEHTTAIARAIEDYASRGVPLRQVFILSSGWIDPRNLAFELGDPGWAGNELRAGSSPPIRKARPLAFVFRANDRVGRAGIRRVYPNAQETLFPQSHPDRSFGIALVP